MSDKAAIGQTIADDMREQRIGFERAVALAGVNRRTAYRWKSAGEADLDAGRDTENAAFARAVSVANAERIARAESLIHNADELDIDDKDRLHNARWILSKLARKDYGDKSEVVIRGEIESLCEAARPLMSQPAFAEMIHAFASLAGLDPVAASGSDDVDEDSLPLH